MRKPLAGILTTGVVLMLMACVVAVATAQTTYTTSKPSLSSAPKKDRPFTASGFIKPKSTASSRATVKIILWMKYGTRWGVMDTYWARLSRRPAGGSSYAVTIVIPMKGAHGVQAVQYRSGRKVSQSAARYFLVQP